MISIQILLDVVIIWPIIACPSLYPVYNVLPFLLWSHCQVFSITWNTFFQLQVIELKLLLGASILELMSENESI